MKMKLIIIQQIYNKATFVTNTRLRVDDFYHERNKHITDSSEKIETVPTSPIDKTLASDKLIDKFDETRQLINSNISSANDLELVSNRLHKNMTDIYRRHKTKLTQSEQDLIDSKLAENAIYLDKTLHTNSSEEISLSQMGRLQKRMTDVILRFRYLQEKLPGDDKAFKEKRESCLEDAEEVIKKFNTLSDNISRLAEKKIAIQKELNARNNPVQDSSDVVQTDYSPFDDLYD
jgi:hypothetical protein